MRDFLGLGLVILMVLGLLAIPLALCGCGTTGQNGQMVGLGHVITTTNADGSTTVEQIPPTAEELAAYRDFAISTATQIAALIEQFKDDESKGKAPSSEEQIKLAMQQALLQTINTWIAKNGGTAIALPEAAK